MFSHPALLFSKYLDSQSLVLTNDQTFLNQDFFTPLSPKDQSGHQGETTGCAGPASCVFVIQNLLVFPYQHLFAFTDLLGRIREGIEKIRNSFSFFRSIF
jgi:hypothetical protein